MAEKEVPFDAVAAAYAAKRAAMPTSFSTPHWDTTVRRQATTLESFTRKETPGSQWSPVVAGEPLPLIVRTDLAVRRNTQRQPQSLAAFAQLTDLHVTDVQSPARMEYVHTRIRSAYRPHEALIPYAVSAIIRRINRFNYGPITSRPLDCVVMTGDGTDNRSTIELEWLLTLLNGGSFFANSGDSEKFEDVGSFHNPYYWLPDSSDTDLYKRHGFPIIPNFYTALLDTPVESPGLKNRWYSVIGNHDSCFMGAFPHALKSDSLYTRDRKVVRHDVDDIVGPAYEDSEDLVENITGELLRGKAEIYEPVTPDERRAPFTRETFVKMHHEDRFVGPGPAGHGLPEEGPLYYTFPITDEIDGIVLDTNFPPGAAGGWMGGRQMEWLKEQLQQRTDRYFKRDGTLVTTDNPNKMVIVFSHHNSYFINRLGVPTAGDAEDSMRSYSGDQVARRLGRYPNVIAWVNGHSHSCTITPHENEDPRRSFWEITCPSFADWPQLARILEVADNRDGTLSIFTTLVEPDVPADPAAAVDEQTRLAALCRQISVNDFENLGDDQLGGPEDCNTELLLAHPFKDGL